MATHLTPNGRKPCNATVRKCKYAPLNETVALPDGHPLLHMFNEQFRVQDSARTETHREALHRFTGLGYLQVRRFLLTPDAWEESIKRISGEEVLADRREKMTQLVQALDEATNQPHHVQAPLYRVITPDDDVEVKLSGQEWANKLGYVPGEVVSFDTFASTSMDSNVVNAMVRTDDEEESSIVFQIVSRTGAIVAPTPTAAKQKMHVQDGEREILLPRGKQYRVASVNRETLFVPAEDTFRDLEPRAPLVVNLVEI